MYFIIKKDINKALKLFKALKIIIKKFTYYYINIYNNKYI